MIYWFKIHIKNSKIFIFFDLSITDKIFNITNDSLKDFTSRSYSNALQQVIKAENTSILILSSSADSKYLGAHLAGFTDGSFISNVVGIPDNLDPFTVKRSCFTNKGFSSTELTGDIKIISISANSFGLIENNGNGKIEDFHIEDISSTITVSNIIRHDSLNIDLGLTITSDIDNVFLRKGFISPTKTVIIPESSVSYPFPVALFGSNPEPQNISKQLKLEVLYSEY